eukprot:Hpha_TRINITY_DN16185_c1_g2::TRINITY_DN16185_c1_g2_i1::g.5512::m.5512
MRFAPPVLRARANSIYYTPPIHIHKANKKRAFTAPGPILVTLAETDLVRRMQGADQYSNWASLKRRRFSLFDVTPPTPLPSLAPSEGCLVWCILQSRVVILLSLSDIQPCFFFSLATRPSPFSRVLTHTHPVSGPPRGPYPPPQEHGHVVGESRYGKPRKKTREKNESIKRKEKTKRIPCKRNKEASLIPITPIPPRGSCYSLGFSSPHAPGPPPTIRVALLVLFAPPPLPPLHLRVFRVFDSLLFDSDVIWSVAQPEDLVPGSLSLSTPQKNHNNTFQQQQTTKSPIPRFPFTCQSPALR